MNLISILEGLLAYCPLSQILSYATTPNYKILAPTFIIHDQTSNIEA